MLYTDKVQTMYENRRIRRRNKRLKKAPKKVVISKKDKYLGIIIIIGIFIISVIGVILLAIADAR